MPLPQKDKDLISNLDKVGVNKKFVREFESVLKTVNKNEIRRKKVFKKLGLKWPD